VEVSYEKILKILKILNNSFLDYSKGINVLVYCHHIFNVSVEQKNSNCNKMKTICLSVFWLGFMMMKIVVSQPGNLKWL